MLKRLCAAAVIATSLSACQTDTPEAPEAPEAFVSSPVEGQAGKDVPWVATAPAVVEAMLDLANVQAGERLVDLGSGDGVTVIAAAKRGARAHGIEFEAPLVTLARERAAAEGLSQHATFAQGDIFAADFADADIVTLFLLNEINLRLRPTLLAMKPGTRIVSNTFNMADWQSDRQVQVEQGCQPYCTVFLWIVPAQVSGQWRMQDGRRLELEQQFQHVSGRISDAGQLLTDAKLSGAAIGFSVDGVRYSGTVQGNRMSGERSDGHPWQAQRQ